MSSMNDGGQNEMEEGGIAMLNTQHDTVVTPDRTKNFGSPGSKKDFSLDGGVRPLRVLASEKVPKYGRLQDSLAPSMYPAALHILRVLIV